MSKRKQFVPGQLVRVGRDEWHGIKFGAVCRVIRDCGDGDIEVTGPTAYDFDQSSQYVDGANCKLAKQATKQESK